MRHLTVSGFGDFLGVHGNRPGPTRNINKKIE